jgi:hypothetical protein
MDEFFAEEEEIFSSDDFHAEVKAFERASSSGKLAELLSSPLILGEKKRGREIISSEDRFLIAVDAMCRKMNAENIIKLTETDINTMLEKTTLVSGLKYKNHIGYILGYIASHGGKSLKPEQIDYVIKKILPSMGEEGGITPPDVIRYARYWKMYL